MSETGIRAVDPVRAVAVTAGLAVAGGVVGAGVGAALLAVLGLVVDGPGGFPFVWDAFVLAGFVGGVLGAVLFPVSAWTLLRRVSFGQAFAGTALGTAAGGTLGLLLSGVRPDMAVAGAVAGFCTSAVGLYVQAGRASRALPRVGAPPSD